MKGEKIQEKLEPLKSTLFLHLFNAISLTETGNLAHDE